jgi:phosphoesterase RecJ-like protein
LEFSVQNEIKQLSTFLNEPRNVLLVSHYNPDGDAIGSLMGMYHYLKKKGHKVTAMVPNDFPDFLSWIDGTPEILVFNKTQAKASEIISQSDIIICIDFNEFKRLKDIGPRLASSKAVKALIDHHPEPEDIYSFKVYNIQASSTSELIYKYIVGAGDKNLIDKVIGEALYAGIMSDTGCFSYNSSNPETFTTIADLLSIGINKDKVYNLIYNNFSGHRMQLMGYCLSEKMVILPEYHAAYISLTKEEMEKYNFKTGDSEGFVNLPFCIKGIHITALFTEKKEHVSISFRSRGGFAVNEFCSKHFEGGGHRNAAGGESKLGIKETIEKFEKLLKQYHSDIANLQWFKE